MSGFKLPEPIVLKIAEKDYTFHFNNYALVELAKLTAQNPEDANPLKCHIELMEIGEQDPLQSIVYIIYAGVVGYAKSEGKFNHGITLGDIAKPLATANLNEFAGVWDAFKDCTGMGEFLASLPNTDKKKVKRHGKK